MRGGPLWLLALPIASGVAAADPAPVDPPADPHAMFGLAHAPTTEVAPSCADGRDFGCAVATDPLASDVPFSLSTWLPASYLLHLPVANATHDQVVGYALGAGPDDGGPTFGGASGLENRWTIDGAPADDPTTGGVATKIPLAFLDGIMVRAGGFAARDRTSTGGTIDAELRRGGDQHVLDAYAWTSWTAAGTNSPLAPNEYLVNRVTLGTTPSVSAAVVATGPLGHVLGGKAWYAAGIAPTLNANTFTFRSQREVDADGDGNPDAVGTALTTESIENATRNVLTYSVPAMARVGLDSGHQHVELTAIGTVSHNVRFDDNATIQAGGVDFDNYVGDGIATWHADWDDTRVRVQGSWHRSEQKESAHDPAAANLVQTLSAYVPGFLAEDPTLSAACSDTAAADPYPRITNCPVPTGWFASGGAGPLTTSTADRPTITAEVAHRIDHNVLRAGVTDEDSRLVLASHFTGDEQIKSLFVGHTDVVRYLDIVNTGTPCPQDITVPCSYAASSTLTYRTRYAAAYAEDTWQPMPGMLIDGGLRDEYMQVGNALTFNHELAPRFGATYDPLGGGRSRIWISAGRSTVLLPAGLGATILHTDPIVNDITSTIGNGRSFNLGNPTPVIGGIDPTQQDELTAGVEVALERAVRVTAWGQARWLRRGLDTTAEGFDNPGRDGEAEATRQSQQVAVQLETSPIAQLALRVGALYGRVTGTWTGAYDPRQGAVLYAGSDYNTDSTNQYGRLPSDPGGRVYIEAMRRGQLGNVQLALALRLTAGSGRPRNVLADNGDGVIELLPRGNDGTAPLATDTNVRLAARWRGTDFTLDIFNLFDHRDPTNLDEIYTDSGVRPISGGTSADLVYLKNSLGAPALRSLTFQLPTAYQTPFSISLGVHHAF